MVDHHGSPQAPEPADAEAEVEEAWRTRHGEDGNYAGMTEIDGL